MRSLAVKQQQTNRAQGFASGRHSGTCALVCVCDCFLDLFSGNYVKVTALKTFEVCLFHPQSWFKYHNIQIISFVANICCFGFFFQWIPNCSSCLMYHISNFLLFLFALYCNQLYASFNFWLVCVSLKGIEATSVWVLICLMFYTNPNLHQWCLAL